MILPLHRKKHVIQIEVIFVKFLGSLLVKYLVLLGQLSDDVNVLINLLALNVLWYYLSQIARIHVLYRVHH